MLALLAISILVLVVSAAIALALPLRGAVERVAAALLLAHATVTGLLLVAGVLLRALQPTVVALVAVLWALAVGAVLVRAGREPIRVNLAAGLAAAREAAAREAARVHIDPWRWWPVVALAVVVLVAYAWRAVIAVRLPVLDYDGFSYHLVTVDVWLQTGEIGRVPQRLWSDGYPANGELMTLWLMVFTGSDELATLTGLATVPLAFVATIGIARQLGANRHAALLAGLVLAAMPAFIALTTTTYVDVPAVAYMAAAWYLGLAALGAPGGPRRRALLPLAGLAIGLGAGTKATLLFPLAVLGGGLLVDAARRPAGRRSLEAAGRAALVVGLPAAVMGGYWYMKNLLVFGNPLWPFSVGPFPGVGTFAELIVQTPDQLAAFGPIERIVRSWFADPWTRRYVYDTRLGGFGIEWPLLLVLGLAGAALLAGRRRFAPLVLLALPAALTLVTMPMSWWARLTLFVPLLVVGLAAVALTRLPRPAAGALGALIVLATTASLGVATAHGNAYVQQGRSLPSLSVMLRLVRASAEERGSLGIWGECASLAAIPPGSRVAWDSFNMLHAIAGHRYDRFAIAPITATSDSSSLFEQARALDVDILLLHDAGVSLRAATRDPQRFTILGPGCRGTQIVAVSQDTARSP